MTRLLTVIVASSLFLLSGCQKVELKEFSPDGSFKVMFPEKKEEKSQDFGGMPAKIWTSEFGSSGTLEVAVMQIPGGALMDALMNQQIKEFQKRWVETLKGTIISESEDKLADKYTGRKFDAKVKAQKKAGGEMDAVLRGRIYIGNGKMFLMDAIGKADWVNSEEVSKFLDSLQILK